MKIPKYRDYVNQKSKIHRATGCRIIRDSDGIALIEDYQGFLYLIWDFLKKKYVLHREDGPACEYNREYSQFNRNSYFLYGEELKKQYFLYYVKCNEKYNYKI